MNQTATLEVLFMKPAATVKDQNSEEDQVACHSITGGPDARPRSEGIATQKIPPFD